MQVGDVGIADEADEIQADDSQAHENQRSICQSNAPVERAGQPYHPILSILYIVVSSVP